MTEIDQAAAILRRGGLVAFPTETVYGLGANALNPVAVRRIFEVKGRPSSSPLIVHAASIEMVQTIAREWPESAQALAKAFWPGPLTMVLPKQEQIPDLVTASLDTVGVRIPSHPLALSLIEAASVPIAAPSANRFTEVSPTLAEHVRASLGNQVDLILDGGPTDIGIESTVLSLCGPVPLLLRPGMITQDELEALVGPIQRISCVSATAHPSPGLHHRHYSPSKPVILTTEPPPRAAYLWWSRKHPSAISVHMPDQPVAYARMLYSVLHRMELADVDAIAIEPVPESREWDGIRDRLARAQ